MPDIKKSINFKVSSKRDMVKLAHSFSNTLRIGAGYFDNPDNVIRVGLDSEASVGKTIFIDEILK